MTPDSELLRQYAEANNETAFAEVVRRHLNLVYATATRLLNGNTALAEDVTQAVFTSLARKAAELSRRPSVTGWLYVSVRYAASTAVRAEQRRRTRESEALAMSDQTINTEAAWAQLRPLIDEALLQLKEIERDAVLLRFFEERSHREVGATLDLNEHAAQMRVNRALEKMRAYFARHGVTTTVALLATTLGAQAAGAPAPATLAAGIAGKSLSNAATTGPAPGWLQKAARVKKPLLLAGTLAAAASGAFAARSFFWPSPLAEKAVAFASAPTHFNPAPTMNASNLLPTAVLSAALLTTSAIPTTLASAQTVASPVDNARATGQTDGNAPSSNAGGSTSQNSASLVISANSTTTPPPANPAPPGTGIARWKFYWDHLDNRLDVARADGIPDDRLYGGWYGHGPLMQADQEPDLVDTSGALKGKTITDIASWTENDWIFFNGVPFGGPNYVNASWSALCSDGSVVVCNLGYQYPRDNSPSSKSPKLIDTSGLKGKTIATINTGPGGRYILCTDGTVYSYGSGREVPGKGPTMIPTGSDVAQLDLGTTATQLSSVGNDTFLAVRRNGLVVGLGTNEFGVLAFAKDPDSTTIGHVVTAIHPVYSGGALKNKTVAFVNMSGAQALALCTDGTLVHWGYRVVPEMFELGLQADHLPVHKDINDIDKIKDAYLRYSDTPVRVMDETGLLAGKSITQIAHVGLHIMVLCADGTVAAWGGEVAPLKVGDSITSYEYGDVGWWRFYYYARGRGGPQVGWISTGPRVINPDADDTLLDTSPTASTFSYPHVPDEVAAARAQSTAPNAAHALLYGYWGGWGWYYPDLPVTSYPIEVSGVGALAGKTVTAITDGGLILCSDNTLAYWDGFEAPKTVNLGPIQGRTILKIAPGMALFE